MTKGLFNLLFGNQSKANRVGYYGETLTERKLKWLNLFGREGKILRNVYVPKDNGETSEIDVLFITQKGIFVIESKNYSGWIFGDEKSPYWTVMLPNKEKNRFYNPIKQNISHMKWLKQYLEADIPLYSIIVFSNRCQLKKVNVVSEDVYVIKRDDLYAVIRRLWDKAEINQKYTIEEIYEKLEVLTHADDEAKKLHIQNINTKYGEKVEPVLSKDINESIKQEVDLICPSCGSKLILRTAKKGANIGKSFYGCTNFPKCRYTRQIEEK